LIGYGEDVGRHNALDKAIGQAALAKADFGKCVGFSTGRQPADMILKAARVGVPILVSTTSVIYSGVYAAEKTNVTLVGLARSSSLNIYTGKQRILAE
jgi:FdhD protein